MSGSLPVIPQVIPYLVYGHSLRNCHHHNLGDSSVQLLPRVVVIQACLLSTNNRVAPQSPFKQSPLTLPSLLSLDSMTHHGNHSFMCVSSSLTTVSLCPAFSLRPQPWLKFNSPLIPPLSPKQLNVTEEKQTPTDPASR